MADISIPFIKKDQKLTKNVLREQEKKFFTLLDKIMEKSKEYNLTIRVIGSIAFRKKCPDYKYLEYENKRYLTDIDFIAYSKDITRIQDMFFDLNWSEDQNVLRLFGDKRRIFYHPKHNIHSDIFLNKLRFCHIIDFKKRLEIDYPTISLIDLLLEKLQIVEINKKDLVDIMILLRQYPISEKGEEINNINGLYLAKICAKDWGWWQTVRLNLDKTYSYAEEYLDQDDTKLVQDRVKKLHSIINNQKKSIKWKMRSIFGEKFRWYREVESVKRG